MRKEEIERRIRQEELNAKLHANHWSTRWLASLTPNVIALVGAGAVAAYQLGANRNLESTKFEAEKALEQKKFENQTSLQEKEHALEQSKFDYQLLLKAAEQPTPESRVALLGFFVETDSFSIRRASRLRDFLKKPTFQVPPAQPPTSGFPTAFATPEDLKRIMPNSNPRQSLVDSLQTAMKEFEINTPERQAMFLAQVAHESGELRFLEEIGGPEYAKKHYENRADLGNVNPGDGYRYRGRGLIQIVGRRNYAEVAKALGVDLVARPERAAEPAVACRIAAWYWKSRGCNELADRGDFNTITRRINGGLFRLDSRRAYYKRALEVLKKDPAQPLAAVLKSTRPKAGK